MIVLNYLKLGIWSMIYYMRPSDIISEIIVNTIKKSGPFLIKLVQWTLPKIEHLYEINSRDKDNEWFFKLEELYEDCGFHSLEYTKRTFKEEFNIPFETKYTEIEEFASGSIGQVYRIKDKKGKEYAMKVLHPDVHSQVYFFKILFYIINYIRPLRRYIQYYFPIDLCTFIRDFQMQTNLINEANNILRFSKIYEGNDYIIIPELYKVSKEIIIMSFEEGEVYNKSSISEYTSYKIISLLKLFNKNNETIHNFIHSDLHKKNWKVRRNKNDIKLVIYDFGFCWELPTIIRDNLKLMNGIFLDMIIKNKSQSKEEAIKNLVEIGGIFSEGKFPKELIQEEVKIHYEKNKMRRDEPIFFIKLLLSITRRGGDTVNSFILQCIILHTQMDQLYTSIFDSNFIEDDKDYNEKYAYFKYFGDLINFAETNHIFEEYLSYLKNEIKENQKRRNIKREQLFIYNKELDKHKLLKDLCIQDD
tara:strand:+ start:568 stop:1989 length:1422 start_codon:yes stop_codon:yes gene_type:complete